jgi:hypothetical protein
MFIFKEHCAYLGYIIYIYIYRERERERERESLSLPTHPKHNTIWIYRLKVAPKLMALLLFALVLLMMN